MAKSANMAALKWQEKASMASGDYAEGAKQTTKDQAALAIAAKENYKVGLQESISQGRYEKGLQKSGKAGWLKGIEEKGANNYSGGISSSTARAKYISESSKYDSARNAAQSVPRGPKGSPANINRVTAVVTALRAVKVGK